MFSLTPSFSPRFWWAGTASAWEMKQEVYGLWPSSVLHPCKLGFSHLIFGCWPLILCMATIFGAPCCICKCWSTFVDVLSHQDCRNLSVCQSLLSPSELFETREIPHVLSRRWSQSVSSSQVLLVWIFSHLVFSSIPLVAWNYPWEVFTPFENSLY